MKKILFTMAIATTAILFQSCGDNNDPEPEPAKSKTELLTASGWITTSGTVEPGIDVFGVKITDFYSFTQACDKDDIQKFNSDKTGATDEGATKCDPNDPQSTPFVWSWAAGETKLIIDGDTADLIELTATTMKISRMIDGDDFDEDPPMMHKVTFTFRH